MRLYGGSAPGTRNAVSRIAMCNRSARIGSNRVLSGGVLVSGRTQQADFIELPTPRAGGARPSVGVLRCSIARAVEDRTDDGNVVQQFQGAHDVLPRGDTFSDDEQCGIHMLHESNHFIGL